MNAQLLTAVGEQLRAAGLHLSPAETAALNAASDPQPTDYPYGELGRQQRDRRLAGGD